MAFQQYQVVGVKGYKGQVDGQNIDSCKVRVMLRCSERAGTEIGFDVADWPFGKEENYQALKAAFSAGQIKFPCMLDLDVEDTTKGKEIFGWKIPSGKSSS